MDIVEHEEWRTIPGLTGYEASSLGRIRSLDRVIATKRHSSGRIFNGRILKSYMGSCGYLCVRPSSKNHLVHRLVASAFFGSIPDDLRVNHKSGDKSDCRISNLELCTAKENTAHAIEMGLKNDRGEAHKLAKLDRDKVLAIRACPDRSDKSFAKEFGVSDATVYDARWRKTWKHITGTDPGIITEPR